MPGVRNSEPLLWRYNWLPPSLRTESAAPVHRQAKGKMGRIRSLYRHSKILCFIVDHRREAKRLRSHAKEAADEAHLTGLWNFENPTERKWQGHVLQTLSKLTGKEQWGDALEIGCSEGVFTEQLASKCASLSAYEISPVAAERARKRCQPY